MGNLESLNFDASKVEPNLGFDVLPAGEYDVVIAASELKPTRSGNGHYVKLEMQVLNGPYQNRKLFDNLNLYHPNFKTVEIAKKTLSAICRAIGVNHPNDSTDLHNRPLKVKVAVTRREDTGEEQNVVKAYKERHAGPPSPPPPITQSPMPTSPQPVMSGPF